MDLCRFVLLDNIWLRFTLNVKFSSQSKSFSLTFVLIFHRKFLSFFFFSLCLTKVFILRRTMRNINIYSVAKLESFNQIIQSYVLHETFFFHPYSYCAMEKNFIFIFYMKTKDILGGWAAKKLFLMLVFFFFCI